MLTSVRMLMQSTWDPPSAKICPLIFETKWLYDRMDVPLTKREETPEIRDSTAKCPTPRMYGLCHFPHFQVLRHRSLFTMIKNLWLANQGRFNSLARREGSPHYARTKLQLRYNSHSQTLSRQHLLLCKHILNKTFGPYFLCQIYSILNQS